MWITQRSLENTRSKDSISAFIIIQNEARYDWSTVDWISSFNSIIIKMRGYLFEITGPLKIPGIL